MTDTHEKKRILIFSTAYFPFVGGAEIAVKEITDRLPGFEFVMITAKLKKELADTEKIGNVTVHRIGKGNGWDKYRLILNGWKKAKELGVFNTVWSIMASYAGFATLRFNKRNPQVPFLLTLQEGDSRWDIYKHVWWCWPYFKQIFKWADNIQAISNYLASWAKEMGATCPIEVVPNGVVIEKVEAQEKNNDIKRIITVSRLVKKNGLEHLVRAIEIVTKKYHKSVVLKIVGDGELRNKLTHLADSSGLKDNVTIIGNVSYKEVYQHLKQADVFVRPSLSEGLGNAFLEAMAAAVPVIGTRVGGIPDFLKDGETGWFCEPKNPDSIAEKISYVLDEKNKDIVQQVVKNARELVEEKYSWDLIAKQMKELFV